MDLSNETIKELFYKQIREMTLRKINTFDLQFSGKLLEKRGEKNGRRNGSRGRRIITDHITC